MNKLPFVIFFVLWPVAVEVEMFLWTKRRKVDVHTTDYKVTTMLETIIHLAVWVWISLKLWNL
jgi:hypothetical protein